VNDQPTARQEQPEDFKPWSVSAMFARILAEGSAMKEYVKDRLDRQDEILKELFKQGRQTKDDFNKVQAETASNFKAIQDENNKRITALEATKEEFKGKIKGFTAAWGCVIGLLAMVVEKIMDKLFQR
jgi:hypothetical protein